MSKKGNHQKNKGFWLTIKDLNHMKTDIVHQVMILSSAYLMEEKEFSDERILEYWEKISEWVQCIKDHLISIQHVVDIINEHTGANLHYNYVEENTEAEK